MQRRDFLKRALAVPLIVPSWEREAPRAYLDELAVLMRAAPVPGAVIGLVKNLEVAWIAPLGVQAIGTSDKVTSTTLFQAASLTKQITAHAALTLYARRKLDLDRPLVSYVDDLPDPSARSVTARHVLSHSSGFPNWRFAEPGKAVPPLTSAFRPGSRYSYSGEGFFYLQRVLEQITGKGFGQVAQELVFDPQGMKSTTLVWDPETLSQTALPHDRHGEVRTGWDKSTRALRVWAGRHGKTENQLKYEDYAAATLEAGDPVLPN